METSHSDVSIAKQGSLAAIALAGGNSSRMGQDKALLIVDGVPLLQRICQVAHHCGADPVYVVTRWVDRYRAIAPDVQFIQEAGAVLDEPQGPLVGFAQGLAVVETQRETQWVLLLACDLPRLQVEVLTAAIAQLPSVPSTAIAFLPRQSERWEPLCGFYRLSCLPQLQAFVQSGGRSFQRWLATQSVAELHLIDPTILFNCNTPEDLTQSSDR